MEDRVRERAISCQPAQNYCTYRRVCTLLIVFGLEGRENTVVLCEKTLALAYGLAIEGKTHHIVAVEDFPDCFGQKQRLCGAQAENEA